MWRDGSVQSLGNEAVIFILRIDGFDLDRAGIISWIGLGLIGSAAFARMRNWSGDMYSITHTTARRYYFVPVIG